MLGARFPTAFWPLSGGGFTAVAVEDFDSAAVGDNEAEAVAGVKEYLNWRFEDHDAVSPWQDVRDVRLSLVKVPVRTEHRVERQTRKGPRLQVFPSTKPVSLVVGAVHGQLTSGVWLCSLPQLQQVFYFYDRADLEDLVRHTVQESFKGGPPDAVLIAAAPPAMGLSMVVISTAWRPRKVVEYHLPTVEKVADPVGDAGLRRALSRAYEREDVVADLVSRLTTEKGSLVLVGPTGTGKTAVLVDAVRIVERQAPDGPRRRFWLTRAGRLLSGMRYLGEWQDRCEALIEELADAHGVLCVENLLELLSGGRETGDSIGAFLVPYLQRGELRLVAEATPAELDACRRLLPSLADVLAVVRVPELPPVLARAALARLGERLEEQYHRPLETGTVPLVHSLFRRFLPYHAMPGAAARFLQRVCAESPAAVGQEPVLKAFAADTGLPERLLRDDVPLPFETVLAELQRDVIGQDHACEKAAAVVTRFKAGLNDPGRPLGVLLLTGPTGTGKTELARSLARYLFGQGRDGDRLVRIDMSEYGGHGSEQRLLTGPDGGPSALVRRLREQPLAVVLFDEIEKASPAVFDVLLTVLDEGRLTDPMGRVTNFCSALIVMTSNLGVERLGAIGLGPRRDAGHASAVQRFFRPEFFNRLDAVVTYAPLSPSVMRAIVAKEVRDLAAREGLAARGLSLTLSDRWLAWLVANGSDERYGARPLQRVLEASVVVPLAHWLLSTPEAVDGVVHMDGPEPLEIRLA